MKKKHRISFIINPSSGKGLDENTEELILKSLDTQFYDADFTYTEYPGHATAITKEKTDKSKIVVAVGGDGTVNETVNGLHNTGSVLAIIPLGSGNGLAKHLNIPGKVHEAVELINRAITKRIDTLCVNNRLCVNLTGIGFDAHIGKKFQTSKKRNFWNYIKLVIKEFTKYQTEEYQFSIDGESHTKNAFCITLANSTQFGNNAYIAPKAMVDDGKIDVVIINRFPNIVSVDLAYKLFNKAILNSKYTDFYRAREVKIKLKDETLVHIDGEPIYFTDQLNVKIQHKSLKVICPL